MVTGHSLGGALAAALASCIATWRGGAGNTSVYAFAAVPRQQRFRKLFQCPVRRAGNHEYQYGIYNDLDVMPNAWATLPTIETYYPPALPCPRTSRRSFALPRARSERTMLSSFSTRMAARVELRGSFVSPLSLGPAHAAISPIGLALFLWEAAQQHHTTPISNC